MDEEKHIVKKWEVSLMEFEDEEGRKYRVLRRLPFYSIAETRVFATKEEAKKQFDAWLEKAGHL